jgi:hypothetical protein
VGGEDNGMIRKKETTPSRQANRVAQKSNNRLTQEEWNALWERDGWILFAQFAFLFAFIAFCEIGAF